MICLNKKTAMTVYYCLLQAASLDGLPSSFDIINLCIYMCKHIFEHCDREVLVHNLPAKIELRTLFGVLMGSFKLLKQFSINNDGLTINHYIHIRFLNARFSPGVDTPNYNQSFDLHSLHDVPVRIILAILDKLIKESLTSIRPYILDMPPVIYNDCFNTLVNVPANVTKVATRHLNISEDDVNTISTSTAFTVMVKALFYEEITQ